MSYNVKSIGSNGSYQLGLDDNEDHDSWKDVRMSFTEEPFIHCGGNHTVVLSGSKIYSCGDNSSGQCGQDGDVENIIGFKQVPTDLENWLFASTGWAFSLFGNDTNEIWSCGMGLNGELGLGKDNTKVKKLTLVQRFEHKIAKICSSLDHTVVLLSNGDCYGWGNNKKSQLLQHQDSKANKIIYEPVKLDIGGANGRFVTNVILGRDFSVFQLQDGSFQFYGRDKFNIATQLPALIDHKIVDMKSMWSSIHFLIDDKDGDDGFKILSMGNNSHGQLFPPLKGNRSLKIDRFCIGSEHGMIKSSSRVFAWGWGEHGNCGRHMSGTSGKDVVTFDYLNKIYDKQDGDYDNVVKNLYCGCATSWLVLHKMSK